MTMKIFRSLAIGLSLVMASACTLDLREDPNAVQLSQIDVNLSINAVQTTFAGFYGGASGIASPMVRLTNSGGSRYNNVFTPNSFSGIWGTAYSSFLSDAAALTTKADEVGLTYHAGMCRVMTAYVLVTMVDFFGDIPYSEALQGSANFNPKADSGQDIYLAAFDLLDEAIVNFNTASTPIPSTPPFADYYYGGSAAKWKKLANTIKLKMFLNWRLLDASQAQAGISAVLGSPDGIISTAAENFIFRFGTSQADPEARHPNFTGAYISGGGTYMSNHLMWSMLHGYGAETYGIAGDPRMRFYFYRQTGTNSSNPNEMRCVTEQTPLHYPFASGGAVIYGKGGPPPGITTDANNVAWARTYCYPSSVGYWGRDHVDNQGIPPDGFLRSTWGPYPSGGRFDANVNTSVAQTLGMRGAGFHPIIMRSYVNFMLAEAANYLTLTNTTKTAADYYADGIQASFDDVRNWAVNGTFATTALAASPTETSTINTFYPSATYTANVNTYKAAAQAAYAAQTSADGRMNFIAREYWIAAFGNGVEAYNMYRRTGLPSGMQPTLDPNPGDFPRSWWYPQTYVTLNSNAEQKADLTTKVFWDKNASDLNF